MSESDPAMPTEAASDHTPDSAGPTPMATSTAAAATPTPGPALASTGDPATRTADAVAAAPLDAAALDRRRFFRTFATDVFHTAATVVGAATALQRTSVDAASAILGGADARNADLRAAEAAAAATTVAAPGEAAARIPARPAASPVADRPIGMPGPAVGYHSAFRVDGERIVVVDQRRLPFALVEVDCRTAIDVANEMTSGAMSGGPALGQAAALGLAFSANRLRATRPYARRAILRAAETTLLSVRPTSGHLRAAVARVMAPYRAIGELDEDGERIADAMQREADAILFEANDDHGRIADAAAARIPRRTDRPTGVLTLGVTGAMAGGQFGTAMGAIQAATWAEQAIHVYVLEGRPRLDGARIAVWELAQAEIDHTVVPDSAAGWLLASGRVDVVLVGAETIARNGDVANDAGTYPVAALASRHGVPVIVCTPLAAVDPEIADGRDLVTGARPEADVLTWAGGPVTLEGTRALSPILDVTPAGLITALATEEGLLEPNGPRAIEEAIERRARRLPGSLAGAAVVATGQAAGTDPGAPAAQAQPGTKPADT